jgi:tetratricopeptide (TPR) repeat protein
VQNNKLFKFIIKLIFSFISVCLLLEGIFRLFTPATIIPAHTVPAFGNPNAWKKNITFNVKNPLNKLYQATINKNHFRNLKDFSYEKSEKTIRIMGFGNSVMWGSHVNDNETFGYYLEQILNRKIRDLNFEFLNIGKGGWSLINQLIYLKNEGFKYSPDLLILFRQQIEYHFLNLNNIEFSKIKSQRLNNGKVKIFLEGVKPKVKESFLIEKLVRRLDRIPFYFDLTKVSQLLNQIRKKVSALWATGVLKKEGRNNLEDFLNSIDLKDSEEVEWIIDNNPYPPLFKKKGLHLSQFTKKNKNLAEISLILHQWFLEQIVDFAERRNIKILVVETPANNQVLEILPPPKTKSYFSSSNEIFIERLLSNLIVFQRRNNAMLLFPDDVHFTPAGNHLAAMLAYNSIIENRLFSKLKSKSKFDWLSPGASKLVERSNHSIKKEIHASRYSLFIEGWNDIKNMRYSEAEANLSKYLEVNDQKQAVFFLCYVYFIKKKFTEAKSCFYSLSDGFILSSLKYRILTEMHLENREHEKALKALDSWKKLYPLEAKESAEFNYLLGSSFWQAKKMGFAELYLKLAVLKKPKSYLISSTLGSFYFEQKRYKNAIQEFERVIKLKLDDSKSYLFLAIANYKISNLRKGNYFIKEFIWHCKESCQKIIDKNDWLQN